MTALLDAVRRYAEAHADETGLAQTPIPGLATARATAPSDLVHAVARPLVCLVLQGGKQVTTGAHTVAFAAGDSLLITADVPTVSQITRASVAAPYLSLVLELDAAVIAELAGQMGAVLAADPAPVRVEPTDAEVADAALRLMRLLDRRPWGRCCRRSSCASCTTGFWPVGTGRRFDVWVGRTATRGVWRARWRCFGPSSRVRCRPGAWRPWPR